MVRINVGCGMTPTKGWLNFDNSLSVRLAAFPTLSEMLHAVRMLNDDHMEYIRFCQKNNIRWADVTRKIPAADGAAEVLYSSHMLEHLDREEAMTFLREAKRVLAAGGVIRLALPDVRKRVQEYLESGDADRFMTAMLVCVPKPRTLYARLQALFVGARHHQWMYDGKSLCRLLSEVGFADVRSLSPGETNIKNPAPLDLQERAEE